MSIPGRYLLLFFFLPACQQQTEKASQHSEEIIRTNNDNIRTNRTPLSLGPDKLSEHGLFTGRMSALEPAEGVWPYELNMPLFSDYADKSRFIYLPENTRINTLADGALQYPEGTKLVKTFHFPANNENGRKLLETRIIENTGSEWKALTYIWNDEQTDAYLEVAGGNMHVEREVDGVLEKVRYSVPDVNQCKTCHGRSNRLIPLGPKVSQLNRDYRYSDGRTENQLSRWKNEGILALQEDASALPSFPSWAEAGDQVEKAARAYLDSNCGSCHHPGGSANTSGLFLSFEVTDKSTYGVMKKPVAAGKGSGARLYDIVPGKPEESILLFRMESTNPGIMMPELGRSIIHQEGVALVSRWIQEMEATPAAL